VLSSSDVKTRAIHEADHTVADDVGGAGWAPLAVPPLTILLLASAALAHSPEELAIAAVSLLAIVFASVAFASAGAEG
jgi:hypothetical protein